MTLIETRPDDTAEKAEPAAEPTPRPEPTGVEGYLGTGDHKKIGRAYIGFGVLFLVASTLTSVLLGAERINQSGFDYLDTETYFQALTLNSQGLTFIVLLPLILGLAIYVVPLQVGARSLAFPRAAALSLWGYVLSSGMVIASYATNGGPGGGQANAVDIWVLSFSLLILSLLIGVVSVVTTVLTMRSPGMYLDRVPLFSWSMLVAGVLWIATLPVMLGILLLVYLDHRYGRIAVGGNFDIYAWVHWASRQPQVFLYAVPALGIISEIVQVASGSRQKAYRTMMALIGIVGALGFGAYTVLTWSTLSSEVLSDVASYKAYDEWVFIAALWVLPIPFLALLGGWTSTIISGRRRRISAPLLYALASGLLLLAAAISAAIAGVERFELLQSTWVLGSANLAILGTIVALFGGLHYWAVKIWGRPFANGAGMLVALVLLVGAALVGLGELIAGAFDQPDMALLANTPVFDGVVDVSSSAETGNLIAAAGWAVVALGVIIFILTFIRAVTARTDESEADPWEGFTLEWAAASPPPPANFDEVALVTSATPLLDERAASGGTEGDA